jgi:hypothetical protein
MRTVTMYGLDITYTYQPVEPMELEYPGCDESFDIESVEYDGEDISELMNIETLEEKLEEYLRQV